MKPATPSLNRRRSPRFKAQIEARLLFGVVLSGKRGPASGRLHLVGHTQDISEVGLALVVPVAEIDQAYLMGENSEMQIELYLPDGPLHITARPVRYKRLDESLAESVFTEGYLIGADITHVSDRDLFLEYLSKLEE